MDRNNLIGFFLLFGLLFAYTFLNKPTPEQLEEMERQRDSIEQASQTDPAIDQKIAEGTLPIQDNSFSDLPDTLRNIELEKRYGIFGTAAAGTEETTVLENELVKVTFSNKGGKIKEVEMKQHFKMLSDSTDEKSVLKLMEDEKNKFEYKLPLNDGRVVKTSDLFFQTQKSDNSITFRADAGGGKFFEQKYSLKPGSYEIDYDVQIEGLNNTLATDASSLELNWVNYMDKMEKSTYYERIYSSVHFKEVDDDPSYCSCTSDGDEDADGKPLQWVSHSNQFFNASLMAEKTPFKSGAMTTKMLADEDDDLKISTSVLQIPYGQTNSEKFDMKMYVGPNDYELMSIYDNDLELVIPFGSSIFGTINRHVVRPLFNFISRFFGNKGIVILILILFLKTVLYPLQYKALYSQAKMAGLKPMMAKIREKHGDDQQAAQMENMKLYREYGVSPVGGCLPMMAQFPIWIALYRFFPASIEFRQASFLWAPDLSTYDAFFQLPFEVWGFGSHISLFTLLWALSTLVYTYYNTKHMDMAAMNNNPMMKYMQYLMPVMFMGFFNSYASGLTAYLFFGNLINIAQTIITKEVIIDKEKIKLELQKNKAKPKKKGGFSDRLQEALKEQQKKQADIAAKKNKKKKK